MLNIYNYICEKKTYTQNTKNKDIGNAQELFPK